MIRQDKLQFTNYTPIVWMKREKEVKIANLPGKDMFIIINPEEIGKHTSTYAQFYLQSELMQTLHINFQDVN